MEANTSQSKWFVPCCESEECHTCKGKGLIYPDRCPSYYYKNDVITLRYLYDNYKNKNILPFNGSPMDQPKILIDTFQHLDYYIYLFEKLNNKHKEENRNVTDRLKKKMNG